MIRCIGDPDERFQEDPVRMLRAVAMAARLGFTIDPPMDEAIADHARQIAQHSPARLIEEYYKILRSGASEQRFRMLAELRLLEPMAPELQRDADARLWASLAALDGIGSASRRCPNADQRDPARHAAGAAGLHRCAPAPRTRGRRRTGEKSRCCRSGMLPLARRDVERLRQILALQRRLLDMNSPRAKRALMHRGPFHEALTWLEIHGQAPEVVEHWRGFSKAAGAYEGEAARAAERPPTAPAPAPPTNLIDAGFEARRARLLRR